MTNKTLNNTNEIRRGNWVYMKILKMYIQVAQISKTGIKPKWQADKGLMIPINDFESIQLTDNILTDWCNFETDGFFPCKLKGEKYTFITDCKYLWIYTTDMKSSISIECKYLHELQNAFYLFEKEEMKINIPSH